MIVPAMPRIPRGQQAGFVYHVINRGNGRATIFHKPQDYFGLRLFQTFQWFDGLTMSGFILNRFAPFITGISPFEPFQSFKRFAPFKTFPEFLKLRKVQRTQVGGRVAIEPLTLRHNRCRARIAIFYPVTHGTSLTQAATSFNRSSRSTASLRSSRC